MINNNSISDTFLQIKNIVIYTQSQMGLRNTVKTEGMIALTYIFLLTTFFYMEMFFFCFDMKQVF